MTMLLARTNILALDHRRDKTETEETPKGFFSSGSTVKLWTLPPVTVIAVGIFVGFDVCRIVGRFVRMNLRVEIIYDVFHIL